MERNKEILPALAYSPNATLTRDKTDPEAEAKNTISVFHVDGTNQITAVINAVSQSLPWWEV